MQYVLILALLISITGGRVGDRGVPVHLAVGALSFPLEARPADRTIYEGVPYVSDVAFWRINGNALDISSHCTETPGSEFYQLRVGDKAILEYSKGRQAYYIISEILTVKYKSASDPFSDAWVIGEVEYTAQDFANFIYSKQSIILHTSLCYSGLSFGQTFYVLTPN